MKQTIIYISGWGTDERIWSQLKDVLDDKFNYIYIPWNKYLNEDIGDINIPESSILIAWSLGSLFALKIALDNPNIEKLVLLSPTSRMLRDKGYRGVNGRILQSMIDKLQISKDEVIKDFAANASDENPDFIDLFVAQSLGYSLIDLQKGLEFLKDTDLRDVLENITVPTLVIHGNQDKILPVSQGQYIVEKVKDAKSIFLEAGHDLPVSKSLDVSLAVKEFLCLQNI